VPLPELRRDWAIQFFGCAVYSFKRLAIFMRRGLWLFLVLVVKLCGNPSAAAEFVVADGPYRDKDASPSSGSPSPGEPMESAGEARSSWRLVRSAEANNEPGSVAILHTVDFERSNPRLAGLMLRCGRQGIETVIVVVEPYPPHARPQITLRALGQEFRFIGTILPTGAGIRLPSDATGLVTGPWHKASELDNKSDARGTPPRSTALSALIRPFRGARIAKRGMCAKMNFYARVNLGRYCRENGKRKIRKSSQDKANGRHQNGNTNHRGRLFGAILGRSFKVLILVPGQYPRDRSSS